MSTFVHSSDFRSWGGTIRATHSVARPQAKSELLTLLELARRERKPILAVGLGRSYGDSCLNATGALIVMTGLQRIIHFDPIAGTVQAEAGVTLGELTKLTLPHAFLPPVLPGTQHITLGGAIANDVHGKNHLDAGTFGCHVRRLELLRSDGSVLELGPGDRLFAATVGGLGLTGIITRAEIQLQPVHTSTTDVEDVAFADLDEFYSIDHASRKAFPYTAAWIDCARSEGAVRGVYKRGRHSRESPPLPPAQNGEWAIPLPGILLTGATVRVFNKAYYATHRRKTSVRRVPLSAFLHPLDRISDWNRIYGRRGFYQYQLVVPTKNARDAMVQCFREIAKAGESPFLAVLKTFGSRLSPGLLTFPMAGTTLALDFPNRGSATLALLDRLDSIVRKAKGRLYPAKDGRMSAEMFRATYSNVEEFAAHVDPAFCSDFWKRATALGAE